MGVFRGWCGRCAAVLQCTYRVSVFLSDKNRARCQLFIIMPFLQYKSKLNHHHRRESLKGDRCFYIRSPEKKQWKQSMHLTTSKHLINLLISTLTIAGLLKVFCGPLAHASGEPTVPSSLAHATGKPAVPGTLAHASCKPTVPGPFAHAPSEGAVPGPLSHST